MTEVEKQDYKAEQKKSKQRFGQVFAPKAHSQSGTVVVNGVIHKFTKQGVQKLGIVVSGQAYLIPPKPLNKKEARKMKEGKPYLDKKRKLTTPGA